jgi:hypothetical protein
MTTAYLLFLLTLLILGGGAVLALAWAISAGHLQNTSQVGNSIFAADEPIGEMTDMVLYQLDRSSRRHGHSNRRKTP